MIPGFFLTICILSGCSMQSGLVDEKVAIDSNKDAGDMTKANEESVANALYDDAISMINGTRKKYAKAYERMNQAAQMGHTDAKREMALGYLMGDYLPFDFDKTRSILEELTSQHGDPESQFYLGFMHAYGLGSNSSQSKALLYYSFAAASENPFGQMAMAYRQLKQVNVGDGCEAALPLYSRVAGNVANDIKLGTTPVIHRIRIQDEVDATQMKSNVVVDEEILDYYQLLAERGNQEAQMGLGLLYYSGGRGIRANFQRALYYFDKAAKAGNINAYSYMGKIYAQGDEFVPQDSVIGLRLLRHAVEKNDPVGQSGLGLMYYHGIGVPTDYHMALKYFQMAATQKNVEGFLWLGIMHYNGKGIKRDTKLALEYFTLASQGGHVLGPYYLAYINAYGLGILRNCEISSELFKTVAERGYWSMMFMDAYHDYKSAAKPNQAFIKYAILAELGYEVAQSNAAFLLDKGSVNLFSKRECMKMAFSLYSRTAGQKNGRARVRLGDFFYYGYGDVKTDMNAAVTQYKAAVDVNVDPQAMFNLGYMYERGVGMKQDLHLAKRYYDMAIDTSPDAYIPASIALIKLQLEFLKIKLHQWFVIKRSLDFLQDMRALRVGTIISGLTIMLVVIWIRPPM